MIWFFTLSLKSHSHLPKKICFICFNESPLKLMKNAFYFILNTLVVLKILVLVVEFSWKNIFSSLITGSYQVIHSKEQSLLRFREKNSAVPRGTCVSVRACYDNIIWKLSQILAWFWNFLVDIKKSSALYFLCQAL